MPFYRVSGSHRDFPFDSATIDFDTTFKPELQLKFLMIRNLNSGFYVPCDSAKATSDPSGKVHINFEIRRNPLVQVMAIVILMAAALFVLIIPFTVRREALPTSVASFFFSIWSIRGIWSSEMKVFPTRLDIIILFLCVLLLLLIGTRFLFRWIRPQRTLDRGASRDHHLTYFCPSGRVLIEFPPVPAQPQRSDGHLFRKPHPALLERQRNLSAMVRFVRNHVRHPAHGPTLEVFDPRAVLNRASQVSLDRLSRSAKRGDELRAARRHPSCECLQARRFLGPVALEPAHAHLAHVRELPREASGTA